MPIRGPEMTDDRLDQLSQVDDAEQTLRDPMHDEDGPIELSASDLVAIDSDEDQEATQVIERSRLEQQSSADATDDDLRTTVPTDIGDGMTSEHRIPDELLQRSLPTRDQPQRLKRGDSTDQFEAIQGPKTEKMQAVGTRPLPRLEDPETTVVRDTGSGEWAEVDDEGFYTFIARTDEEGRVMLPSDLFGDGERKGVMVFVRAKNLRQE